MGYLVYLGTCVVVFILGCIGALGIFCATKFSFVGRLFGILICLAAGSAVIGIGYWEVFVGWTSTGYLNGQYGIIQHTYPVIGGICLLLGGIGTILFVIGAAVAKPDDFESAEDKPFSQAEEVQTTSFQMQFQPQSDIQVTEHSQEEYRVHVLTVQSQPSLNFRCAEHRQNNIVGKCADCGKEICNVCLTATSFKIKSHQNVLPTISTGGDQICPFCIDKLLKNI